MEERSGSDSGRHSHDKQKEHALPRITLTAGEEYYILIPPQHFDRNAHALEHPRSLMEGQRPQVGPAFSVVRNRVRCKPGLLGTGHSDPAETAS